MRRPAKSAPVGQDLAVAHVIDDTYDDPLAFVQLAYPWGEPGELAGFTGPDRWQCEFLKDLGGEVHARGFDGIRAVGPIRMATASGHGIGKSTLVAWIVNWIMSTRPYCQGTITANTYTQLETKTWAAILKWTRLCATSSWFLTTGTRMYHRDYPQTWFCSAQSCREENSEAFAGQHAVSSTSGAAILCMGVGLPFLVAPVNTAMVGLFWFMFKVAVIVYIMIWFRGTFPRFRYDQLMNIGWKYMIPIGIGALVVNAILGMTPVGPAFLKWPR